MHDTRQSIQPRLGHTTMRQEFAFPVLKVAGIAQNLHDIGISVTEDELLNPEKNIDQIKFIFELLAELCTGITREEMAQPAFSGLNSLNYPELHESSVPSLNSYRACGKMMELCGIQDFTIRDFIAPSAKRVRRQLSGIINFAKVRGEKQNILSDLSLTREDLVNKLNVKRAANDVLNNRLAILREQTAEEAKIIAQLEGRCNDIENEITNYNERQAIIREESGESKSTNFKLKDTIASTALQLEELHAQKKKLGSQIVSSPERFRKQIIDVGQSLQAEQKDAKAAERKVRELSAWLNNVEEAQIEVNSALEAVHEVKGEAERQRVMTIELDAHRSASSANKTMLSELDQTAQQLSRQSVRAEEKLSHLRKQITSRGTETQEAVEELHKQLLDAENARNQVLPSPFCDDLHFDLRCCFFFNMKTCKEQLLNPSYPFRSTCVWSERKERL
jgi:kinetochore protein Nuf2